MHSNFKVTITIPNKAVEELSKRNIIHIDIDDYKDDNGDYIFENIKWNSENFCGADQETAIIYFKDGKSKELTNCDDIFGDDFAALYLSNEANCFYDYIEETADCDEDELSKLEDITITDNEIKNWLPGMSAQIYNSRIEFD